MPFVVETGAGIAGANSYTSIAFADAYFAERGNTVWAAIIDPTDKEKYLIRATDYIELVFGRRFIGDMAAMGQALSWPRYYAYPHLHTVIPLNLQKATAEYALRAIDGPLLPDPMTDSNGFLTVVTKKVIGPIEKEFKVMGGGRSAVRSYPVADAFMVSLLAPGTGGTRVIR